MPYVTSVERIGIKKGLQQGMQEGLQKGLHQGLQKGLHQGLQEGLQKGLHQGLQKGLHQGLQQGSLEEGRAMIIEALDERFGKVPSTISSTVNQIKDGNVLKFLLRQVIRCNSIEEFKQALNRQN